MLRWISRSIALATTLAAVPATMSAAAMPPARSTITLDGTGLSLSPDEFRALSDLGNMLTASAATQQRALAEARRRVRGTDGRYLLARYELEIGRQRGDDAMRGRALDVLLAYPGLPSKYLLNYLVIRGQIALKQNELAIADATWMRLVRMRPDDPDILFAMAQTRQAQDNAAGAADFARRAVAASGAKLAHEDWHRLWLTNAYRAGQVDDCVNAGLALVTAYPTKANWQLALVSYRQAASLGGDAELDLYRLMRAAEALTKPAEYLRMAQLLKAAGRADEAKAVLGEGVARGIVDPRAPPVPAIAAEIDRAVAAGRVPGRSRSGATPVPGPGNDPAETLRRAVALREAGQVGAAAPLFAGLADAPANDDRMRDYARLARFWRALPPVRR